MVATNTANDQLAEELKHFALESTSCGVVISDNQQKDNPLIYVNKGFELVTGYSREEIVGLNCRFLQGAFVCIVVVVLVVVVAVKSFFIVLSVSFCLDRKSTRLNSSH